MTPALSIWLDLCRVLAALAVFAGHAVNFQLAPAAFSLTWHRSADDAVTAFFVISGLVIAHTTHDRHAEPGRYALARLSRVYSVALPAVLLALAIDLVGMRLDASHYVPDWQYPQLWFYLPFHWLFLGETWFGAIQPFTMAPYWSLGYEAWYYLLFGVFIFMKGPKRWLAVVLLLCLMGPRIVLLLPVWCLGVFLYRRLDAMALGPWAGRACMALAAAGYAGFILAGGRHAADLASQRLYGWFSRIAPSPFDPGSTVHVLSDYVVALLFALFVTGCARSQWTFPDPVARVVRWLAGYTFSFYLIHFTLLVFARAMGFGPAGWGQFALVLAGVLLVTWLLGQVGEQRRGWYQRGLQWLWRRRPGSRNPGTSLPS